MERSELLTAAKVLMLKIHVITGWILPSDELKSILIDQFSRKLSESYPQVNVEEVEYAFRNNHVKDWGKAMNLNLVDEVMTPYLQHRQEISRMEEHAKQKKVEVNAPPKWQIELEYALYKLKLIDKLPCRIL